MARCLQALFLCFLAVVAAGCSKPVAKPTEDLRRIEAIQAFFETLAQNLQARHRSQLLACIHPEAPDAGSLRAAVEQDLARAASIRIRFSLQRVRLEEDRARVTLHWEGTWTPAPSGSPQNHKGSVTVTLKGDPPRILEMAGDSFLGVLAP